MIRDKKRYSKMLLGLALMFSIEAKGFASQNPWEVKAAFNWVFSGMVSNEQASRYGYYFELQKVGRQAQVLSALIDVEQKKLLFVEEDKGEVDEGGELKWQVGKSYLGFNPETQRLTLGTQTSTHAGFNFKIDTLDTPLSDASHTLRQGLVLNVIQLGDLKGHVYLGEQTDEFVSAKQTWLRQLSGDAMHQVKNAQRTGVLCQFDDGSAFYAMHALSEDALSGFVAGWRDERGKKVNMSQFVRINHPLPHEWDLSISLPQRQVRFSDLLTKQGLAAGVIEGKSSGFCSAEDSMLG